MMGIMLPVTLALLGIVVDPSGDDSGDGSVSRPFKSIERGLVAARAARGEPVLLRHGTYVLHDPLMLMPADSGLVLESYANETATISGGIPLLQWVKHPSLPGVWQHPMPPNAAAFARQLWVNGVRANRTMLAPPASRWWASKTLDDTYETDWLEVLTWRNPSDVELIFHPGFPGRGAYTEHRCTVLEVMRSPHNTSVAHVRVVQPCLFNIKLTYGRGGGVGAEPKVDPETLPTPSRRLLDVNVSVARIENIFDGPDFAYAAPMGSWYFDRQLRVALYKPHEAEAATLARGGLLYAILPVLEQLVVGRGQSVARPLTNVTLRGLTFAHTTWLHPNSPDGYVPLQACIPVSATLYTPCCPSA